jgi:predicted lipoprotein with Yx(FWY)xxD motif
MFATQMAGWAAGALSIVAYLAYIWSIITGKTRPELGSWLIWSMEYGVLFAALAAAGPPSALWLPGAELAGTLATTGLAFWWHEAAIDWENMLIVGLGTTGALITWAAVGNPYAGVVIILVVDGAGITMTARQAYRRPRGELLASWLLWSAGGVAGCWAARGGGLMAFAFPGFLAITCAIVAAVAWVGKLRPGRHRVTWDQRGAVLHIPPLGRAPWWDEREQGRVAAVRRYARHYASRARPALMPAALLGAIAAAAFLLTHHPQAPAPQNWVLPQVTGSGLHPSGPNRPAGRDRTAGTVLLEKMWTRAGPVLAGSDGITLYKLAQGPGCASVSMAAWRPVTGMPAAVPGAHLTGRFGTVRRQGGVSQATYRGNLLWTYDGDQRPGSIAGNGRAGGCWQVLYVTMVGPVAVPEGHASGS